MRFARFLPLLTFAIVACGDGATIVPPSRYDLVWGDTADVPLFIDDRPGISVAYARAKARKIKRQHGLGLIVVVTGALLAFRLTTYSGTLMAWEPSVTLT